MWAVESQTPLALTEGLTKDQIMKSEKANIEYRQKRTPKIPVPEWVEGDFDMDAALMLYAELMLELKNRSLCNEEAYWLSKFEKYVARNGYF